jgi:hypothetical protein
LWVLENWAYRKDPKNYHLICGEDFIQRTDAYAATSADLVVVSFYNGIEVVNYESTFKTEAEKEKNTMLYREVAKKQRISDNRK